MTLVLGRVQERLGRPLARCEHPNEEAVHNASGADREGEVVTQAPPPMMVTVVVDKTGLKWECTSHLRTFLVRYIT